MAAATVQQMATLKKYDEIQALSMHEEVACLPEVYEFTSDGRTYRLVIVGKRGLPRWEHEPMVKLERRHSEDDALGNPVWFAEDEHTLLTGLLMSLRRPFTPDALKGGV